ncbi:MAG TPA: serine hydrolase [Alphaproteobacteria bacterium]|nr:serine hydrolase [Alphaproteobacteria bacterium]HAJ47343.1 serine hydrolase [Alphaproteobacteria bacterium]
MGRVLLVAFLGLVFAGHAIAQEPRIAGLLTAVIEAGSPPRLQAQGCAVFAEDGRTCARPMREDALVRVASISKLVTALGVMRMVETGKLDLDADISGYLGYPVQHPEFPDRALTLRQLLTHTSALTDGTGYVFGLGTRVEPSFGDAGRFDPDHAPGAFFRYANYNFVVIGTIMERVSGERFDRLMDRLVLTPLSIEGCFNWAQCPDGALAKAAVLYRTGPDETQWAPEGPWIAQVDDLKGLRPPCPVYREDAAAPCDLTAYKPGENGGLFSPQGGLRISLAGLGRIVAMLLSDGQGPAGPFLMPRSVAQIFAPGWQVPSAGETEKGTMCGYGLSIHLLSGANKHGCRDDVFADGKSRAGHIGEAYGLYGGVWIDRAAKRGSIYLVTGTAADPRSAPGQHSAFTRIEEWAAAKVR